MRIEKKGVLMPFMNWHFIVDNKELEDLYYRFTKNKVKIYDNCYYCVICKKFLEDKNNLCCCAVEDYEMPNIYCGSIQIEDKNDSDSL